MAGASKLVVISPHRKSIQNEYLPPFKIWYKKQYNVDVTVEWIDQGGSNDDLKFIKTKFQANPASAGIDVFWGGGTTIHTEIASRHMADKLHLSPELLRQIPKTIGGIPTMNSEGTFVSQAVSSFGIFFNKFILRLERLPEPTSWESLADAKFFSKIILTDPRKSGSASVTNHVILESLGWTKGFELLTAISANARQFAQSSSDVIKAIVAGDAAVTLAIDFYALAKISALGRDKLGFVLPAGKTILEGDPVTILKGAPNRLVADRFVEFIMSPDAQAILMLPQGAPGGPKTDTLGRMAVNEQAYKITEGKRVYPMNPLTAGGFMAYDSEKQAKTRSVLDDLIGSQFIDSHTQLRDAWLRVIKTGSKQSDIEALSKMPVTESDLKELCDKWDNPVFRAEKINLWVKFAQVKYSRIAR